MGSWRLSEKAYKLREQYEKKYNKKPRGWSWEEETMQEYEIYLEKEVNNN